MPASAVSMIAAAPRAALLLLVLVCGCSGALWGRRRASNDLPVYQVVPYDLQERGRGEQSPWSPLHHRALVGLVPR